MSQLSEPPALLTQTQSWPTGLARGTPAYESHGQGMLVRSLYSGFKEATEKKSFKG